MTKYNTGNPIGSTAVKDLYDNAENLDVLVNDKSKLSHPDRLGQQRKTWHGMEQDFNADQTERASEFNADQSYRESAFNTSQIDRQNRFNNFIASSGYQFLGDYAAGIEITEYNQLVRDENGEFWRVSGQVDLPYTTAGTGLPENDAFVTVGDAALRQELDGSVQDGQGGAMVRGAVIYVNTIDDLQALDTGRLVDGQRALVAGTAFIYRTTADEWQPQGPVHLSSLGAEMVDYGVLDELLATTKQISVDTHLAAKIPDTPTFANYGSVTDNVFVAAQLFGGEVLTGDGKHTVRPYSNGVEFDGASLQALFATVVPRALEPSVENITVDGVCVDVGALGSYMPNPRFFLLESARNVKLNNVKALRSVGGRNGYVAAFLNCSDVVVDNFDLDGITGGLNFKFCDGVILNNIRMNDFVEGIDIDSANRNVVARNLLFTNSDKGSNECIEVESSQGVIIDGVVANDVGVLLFAQFKPFLINDYVENEGSEFEPTQKSNNPVLSKNLTLSNVVGRNVGNHETSILIGNSWTSTTGHPGQPPIQNTVLRNINLTDSKQIIVREADGLIIDGMVLDGTDTESVASGVGALNLFSHPKSEAGMDSWLIADVSNVTIKNTTGNSLVVNRPTDVTLRNINCDTDIHLLNFDGRDGSVLSLSDIKTDGSINISFPSGIDARINWGDGVRAKGGINIQDISSSLAIYGKLEKAYLGDLPGTEVGSKTYVFTATRPTLVNWFSVMTGNNVPQDSENYFTYALRKNGDLITSDGSNGKPYDANVPDRTSTHNRPNALMSAGDTISVTVYKWGTGVDLENLVFTLSCLEF